MPQSFPPVEVPPIEAQHGATFVRLVELMRRLLAPDGCPWDREQTLESLRRYVLEEAGEVVEAIDGGDRRELCSELGDLLFQVVFQAELGRDEGAFGPDDVVKAICDKLVRRHPHVFADVEVSGPEHVLRNWEQIKAAERRDKGLPARKSRLEGVSRSLPALTRAQRIGEKVAKVGFDWPDAAGSRAKVDEELSELDEAIARGDRSAIEAELGDAIFALVNLARHVGVEAEVAVRRTTDEFSRRFEHVERRVDEVHGGFPERPLALEELDAYWEEAKAVQAWTARTRRPAG